ncbi:TPA: type 4 pilus major pilin [Salmonella enterica subsp. enterica serovar Sandiego]
MRLHTRTKAFSLLEMMLVLAVAAVLVIGVFMIYPKVSSSQKIDSDMKLLSTINGGIKGIFASKANYDGLSTDMVIKAQLVPEDNIEDGQIWNAWGATVLIDAWYDGSYRIGFENISPDACPKFISQAGASFFKIQVEGTEVKNTADNKDFNVETAAQACASVSDNRPVTVYFYDK